MSRAKCIWITWIKPLRSCRTCAIAKHREADSPKFHRVTMAAPNDDTGHSAGLSFQDSQIADAGFVCSSAVVDDKDIALLPHSQHFQEDVPAAILSSTQNSTHH